jgi:hypothetical protein
MSLASVCDRGGCLSLLVYLLPEPGSADRVFRSAALGVSRLEWRGPRRLPRTANGRRERENPKEKPQTQKRGLIPCLLAYMVGQRSREIGLRMALGVRRWDVLKLILSKGAVLVGVGIVAGVIVSAAAASMMASLLYGVHPHDLLVFLAVPLLLFVVAVLASYLPARRATKVDPMFALREV